MSYSWAIILVVIVLTVIYILNLPVFGKHPVQKRLQRIKNLPNYKDGEVKNESHTPPKADDASYWQMIRKMIEGNENGSPKKALPHVEPDLNHAENLKITWFGHSSYLIQVDGKNILVDPVFSERTSPFQFMGTKRFAGTDFIQPADFPALDIILITHDHYDHLDYASILALKDKTTHFITSLGVGAHLEYWGVKPSQLTELAWGEETSPLPDTSFTAMPARHFSGRLFKRNQTLWSSFVLKTKNNNIYLGGDSGYDNHFKSIGTTYGPFDLAILECGQYNKMWPFIHMFPEEVAQACIDLNAKVLMPVHWGKYKLALHDWDEPIKRVVKKSEELHLPIITPQLGQSFTLGENNPTDKWWLNL